MHENSHQRMYTKVNAFQSKMKWLMKVNLLIKCKCCNIIKERKISMTFFTGYLGWDMITRVLPPLLAMQCNTVFRANLSELLSALLKQSCEIAKGTATNCKIRWPVFTLQAESTDSVPAAHFLLWSIHVACAPGQDIYGGQGNYWVVLQALTCSCRFFWAMWLYFYMFLLSLYLKLSLFEEKLLFAVPACPQQAWALSSTIKCPSVDTEALSVLLNKINKGPYSGSKAK